MKTALRQVFQAARRSLAAIAIGVLTGYSPPAVAATNGASPASRPEQRRQGPGDGPLPYDMALAAAVICAEARGEGRRGMEAVWEVIWERKNDKRRPLTSILTQKSHFTCLNKLSPTALIERMRRTEQWAAALEIVRQPPRTDHVRGADHFARSDERPYWSRGRKPVVVVGRHAFYRLGT